MIVLSRLVTPIRVAWNSLDQPALESGCEFPRQPRVHPCDANGYTAQSPPCRKFTRVIDKKKAPSVTRGVKGGMDMGYRVFLLTTHPTVRAANVRVVEGRFRFSHNPYAIGHDHAEKVPAFLEGC